jgi:hypothetical protein
MGLFGDPFKIISFASGLIAINRRLLDEVLALESAMDNTSSTESTVTSRVDPEVSPSTVVGPLIVFDTRELHRILLGRQARQMTKHILFASSEKELQTLIDVHPAAQVMRA